MVLPSGGLSRTEKLYLGVLLLAALLFTGTQLTRVTDYPFSLTWSEGEHLWSASLFFRSSGGGGQGDVIIPNYVTPGLYGLWGMVFLLPDPGLWVARLWVSLTWILPAALLALLLVHRAGVGGRWKRFLQALWVFLFLSQGPIYPPLLLAAVIVALWATPSRKLRSLGASFAASFYAGLSRWTWMFIPAAWAVLLMLPGRESAGEAGTSAARPHPVSQYLLVLVGGFAGGLLSIWVSVQLTGRPPLVYLGSVQHPLLWYRLLPNPTFPPGILLGLLITTGPIMLALAGGAFRNGVPGLLAQRAFAALVLALSLLVGLVVSVKIGGGSNLHNLDMYLVTLVVLMAARGWPGLLTEKGDAPTRRGLPIVLRHLILLLPAVWILFWARPFRITDGERAQDALKKTIALIQSAAKGGEVLFLDQRQMLAFGMVDVPSVDEYELVEVMDHAMAEDEVFFTKFYRDLRNQRFAAIVSDPLPIVWKGEGRAFGEENDAWVRYVSEPILQWYAPALELEDQGVWVLLPRE